MIQQNPLSTFFRKSKFKISLPSGGKWYAKDALTLGPDGLLDVYAMNASDDIKFKAGDLLVNCQSTCDLIKSCIPCIKNPESMPSIDLDIVLLSIRRASYGDDVTLTFPVPETARVRTHKTTISSILKDLPTYDKWDSNLELVSDSGETIEVVVKPTSIKSVFQNARTILKQNQVTQKLSQTESIDDSSLAQLDESIKSLSQMNISIVCDSIEELRGNGAVLKSKQDIYNFLFGIDVSYFKAIQEHLTKNREIFKLQPIKFKSTDAEIQAGAPEEWEAEINFAAMDFFNQNA